MDILTTVDPTGEVEEVNVSDLSYRYIEGENDSIIVNGNGNTSSYVYLT